MWYVGIHKTNDSILMLTMNQYEEMDRYSRIRFPYETKVNIQIRVLLQRENEKAHEGSGGIGMVFGDFRHSFDLLALNECLF